MADAAEHIQRDINLWDYICIAATMTVLPIHLTWILITKPFGSHTRRKPWRRLLGDAVLRNGTRLDIKQLKYLMGTTPWVYDTWAKWYNLQTTVTELEDGARLMWVGPKRMEKVILYLHGGGYVFPLQHYAASFWRYVQQRLESRGVKAGVAVLNYTLVPTKPFPTPLRHAVAAIEHLLSNGVQPENIQVVGDSAGGNLVLALLSHMLHPLADIPPLTPKKPFAGMFTMSPWLRLSIDDTYSHLNNDEHDVINKLIIKMIGRIVLAGLPKNSDLTPFIEPSLAPEGWFTDAHRFVERVLITAGEKECFHDEIVGFARRFKGENGETQVVVQPDGVHDDPFLDFLVPQPEVGVLTPVIVDWIYEGFN